MKKQPVAPDGTRGAGTRRSTFRQRPDGKIDPAGEAGWYLQYERERRGETLADASVETKIKAKYLHALELGAIDQMPGWPYIVGYVRRYARFLGLEPEPLAQHYLTFIRRPAAIDRFAGRSMWLRKNQSTRATAAIAGTAVVAVMGLWALFSEGTGSLLGPSGTVVTESSAVRAGPTEADPVITGSIRRPELPVAAQPAAPAKRAVSQPAEEEKTSVILDGAVPTVRIKEKDLASKAPVPKPIPKSAVLQSDVETKLAAPADAPTVTSDLGRFIATQVGVPVEDGSAADSTAEFQPHAVAVNSRISLRARANVWTRIEDGGGNALLNRTLEQGEVFHVPDQTGLVLIIRDAGALEFSLDGKPYAPLGQPGQILVSHPLAPDRMRSLGG